MTTWISLTVFIIIKPEKGRYFVFRREDLKYKFQVIKRESPINVTECDFSE